MTATYPAPGAAAHQNQRTLGRLLDRIPRPLRFAAVGGTCAVLQLLILELLARLRVELHLANTLGFLLSTQVNFALNSAITWRDRLAGGQGAGTAGRRLAGYNALALGSLAINQAAFAVALHVAHYLAASALGILAGMLLTYAVSGLVLFRRKGDAGPSRPERDRSPR